jgi:hypothetical protein
MKLFYTPFYRLNQIPQKAKAVIKEGKLFYASDSVGRHRPLAPQTWGYGLGSRGVHDRTRQARFVSGLVKIIDFLLNFAIAG